MSELYVSLVIPAFNEVTRLPRTLETVVDYFSSQPYKCEIIVVDDGSGDGTAEAALGCLENNPASFSIISHDVNKGKGGAVRTGLEAASGKFVFFSDADLSTPIEEIDRMLPLLETDCDIVIGSRALRDSNVEVHQNFLREYGGKTFNLLVQGLVLPGIRDTQCGFKGFRRDIISPITSRQKLSGFSFDVEMLWIARRLGFKIMELPVTWRNDAATKVDLVSDSIKMIIDVIRIRLIHRKTDFSNR